MKRKGLATPLPEDVVRGLAVGDEVSVSGLVVTARDRAHRYLLDRPEDEKLPFDLCGGIVFHCGPLVKQVGERFEMVSCGPTTSARMNPYTPGLLERYGVRAIIGKGGMNREVGEALERVGAVYLSAVGGAGVSLARTVVEVSGWHKLEEFGEVEAMWVLRVEGLEAVVTMDAHGNSLHEEVERRSREALARLTGKETSR